MLKKYIDHQDYDHLLGTLQYDFKPLLNRIKKIEERIKTYNRKKGANTESWNCEIWVNPVNKNKWTIYYCWRFQRKKHLVSFFPFIEFSSSYGEKEYLLLSKEVEDRILGSLITTSCPKYTKNSGIDFKDFLLKNQWFVNIFRGHFLKQFRTRLRNPDIPLIDIFYEFSTYRQIRLVENFVQKEKWLMYLHSHGVAMIKLHENLVIFDTYLSIYELYPGQIKAAIDYLNSLNNMEYTLMAFYLMECWDWKKHLDIERSFLWIREMAKIDAELVNEFLQNQLNYLREVYRVPDNK